MGQLNYKSYQNIRNFGVVNAFINYSMQISIQKITCETLLLQNKLSV